MLRAAEPSVCRTRHKNAYITIRQFVSSDWHPAAAVISFSALDKKLIIIRLSAFLFLLAGADAVSSLWVRRFFVLSERLLPLRSVAARAESTADVIRWCGECAQAVRGGLRERQAVAVRSVRGAECCLPSVECSPPFGSQTKIPGAPRTPGIRSEADALRPGLRLRGICRGGRAIRTPACRSSCPRSVWVGAGGR